jgi:hypothetical protein
MRIHGLTNRELNAVRAQMNKQGQPNTTAQQVADHVSQTPNPTLIQYPNLGAVGVRRLRSVWPYRAGTAMRLDDV